MNLVFFQKFCIPVFFSFGVCFGEPKNAAPVVTRSSKWRSPTPFTSRVQVWVPHRVRVGGLVGTAVVSGSRCSFQGNFPVAKKDVYLYHNQSWCFFWLFLGATARCCIPSLNCGDVTSHLSSSIIHRSAPDHYVKVPVPSPPHVVTHYQTHWNTVVDSTYVAWSWEKKMGWVRVLPCISTKRWGKKNSWKQLMLSLNKCSVIFSSKPKNNQRRGQNDVPNTQTSCTNFMH